MVWGSGKTMSENGQTRATRRREERLYLSSGAGQGRNHRLQMAAVMRAHDASADSRDGHWARWSGDGSWTCGCGPWTVDREAKRSAEWMVGVDRDAAPESEPGSRTRVHNQAQPGSRRPGTYLSYQSCSWCSPKKSQNAIRPKHKPETRRRACHFVGMEGGCCGHTNARNVGRPR